MKHWARGARGAGGAAAERLGGFSQAGQAGAAGTVSLLACMAAITFIALAVRLPQLGHRPMHGDEANQAVKAGTLRETGVYRYDPEDNHGPTLYWLTLPSLWISGHGLAQSREEDYRIVPVVFGVGLVPLLLMLRRSLGTVPLVSAGVLTAISPALVFYSRYYIQEMLLVCFTFAALACAWRAGRSGAGAWAAAAGLFAGLMYATKETWILAAAAGAAGAALAAGWGRVRDGAWPRSAWTRQPRLWLAAAALAAAVAVLFYSSFGSHWAGVADSLRAYRTYWDRGTVGGEHAHPWYFYFERLLWFRPGRGLFWSEGLIAGLAALGFAEGLFGRLGRPGPDVHLVRFLGFYTVVLAGLYAAISYKTPWCMLGFVHGLVLLAGAGTWVALCRLRARSLRILAAIGLVVATAHLAWQCSRLNYVFASDPRNPYVYAHPSRNVLDLARLLENLAQVAPEEHALVIHVVSAENYWPLPWYLRRFDADRVGYWADAAAWAQDLQVLPDPAVIIFTPEAEGAVDTALRVPYSKGKTYNLRPTDVRPAGAAGPPRGTLMLSVYVREDLWQRFVQQHEGPKGSRF